MARLVIWFPYFPSSLLNPVLCLPWLAVSTKSPSLAHGSLFTVSLIFRLAISIQLFAFKNESSGTYSPCAPGHNVGRQNLFLFLNGFVMTDKPIVGATEWGEKSTLTWGCSTFVKNGSFACQNPVLKGRYHGRILSECSTFGSKVESRYRTCVNGMFKIT